MVDISLTPEEIQVVWGALNAYVKDVPALIASTDPGPGVVRHLTRRVEVAQNIMTVIQRAGLVKL